MAYRILSAAIVACLAAASLPAFAADNSNGTITVTKCKLAPGGSICEATTSEKPASTGNGYGPPNSTYGAPQDPGYGPPGRAYKTN
jgi:hypothetical protein